MDDAKPKAGLGGLLGSALKAPSGDPMGPVEGDEADGGTPAESAGADALVSAVETGDRAAVVKAFRAMYDACRARDI